MKIVIHPKYRAYGDFIAQIPVIFNQSGETVYRGRNVVKRFTVGSNEWMVKRYKRPHLIQRIAYTFFKKSKAERAYLYAGRLLDAGIATPEGIAYIEEKHRGLLCDSYFVSTVCPDPAVYPVLVKAEAYDRELADALAAFFVQLHGKGILHGDPNLNNILYRKGDGGGGYLFSVIDTNRSVFKPRLTPRECLENLKRVTHRRDLLRHITAEYARLRGWDVQESVERVMEALDRFEKRNKMKRRLKSFGRSS